MHTEYPFGVRVTSTSTPSVSKYSSARPPYVACEQLSLGLRHAFARCKMLSACHIFSLSLRLKYPPAPVYPASGRGVFTVLPHSAAARRSVIFFAVLPPHAHGQRQVFGQRRDQLGAQCRSYLRRGRSAAVNYQSRRSPCLLSVPRACRRRAARSLPLRRPLCWGAYGSVTAIALPQARAAVSSHSTKSNSPSVSRTAEHTALSSLQPSADIM